MVELSMLPSGIRGSCHVADEIAPERGSALDRPGVAVEPKAVRRVVSVTAHRGKAVFPSPADDRAHSASTVVQVLVTHRQAT